ncbi:hypothetical protein HYV88_00450 [Candidatus Woesearchaeota archaeon]|nr:hypothetical protein [Candidatus Woesearchaeota archaeon]
MANNRTIREETLVNWQSIFNGDYSQVLRGRIEETGSARQETNDKEDFDDDLDLAIVSTRQKTRDNGYDLKKEQEGRKSDLNLSDITWELQKASRELKGIHEYFSGVFARDIFMFPFVDLKWIAQMHDSVEELKIRPQLVHKIDSGLNGLSDRLNYLKELYHQHEIDFLEFEREGLEAFSILGKPLDRARTRLLRDLGDILQSQHWPESPIGDYLKIVTSKSAKVRANSRGFELFSENDEIKPEIANSRFFTPTTALVQNCMEQSSQRGRAYLLLNTALNLVTYLSSLALWARERGFTRPQFNDNDSVDIKNGYHPLLKSEDRKVKREPVTHDTRLNSGNNLLIVTGPNAAGKTTYLKELALISILAQAGGFVPADYANLPIYRRFLTHFSASEDLMSDLSLFQAEITQLNGRLNRLEERTLFICDELFRGTESGENGGAKLHSALVEALSYDFPGRTLLSTHYHEALAKQRNLRNAVFVKVNTDKAGTPSYTISRGIDSGGYAVQAAIRMGLSDKISKRLTNGGE